MVFNIYVGAGPACVVGALAPYNHGVLLAGAAREHNNRGQTTNKKGDQPVAF